MRRERGLGLHASRRRPEAQAGIAEPFQQLAARHLDRSGLDGSRTQFRRHVVVIAVERPSGKTEFRSEPVQFVEIDIAHQMTPAPSAPRPETLVDQQRHAGHPVMSGLRSPSQSWSGPGDGGTVGDVSVHDALLHARWRSAVTALGSCDAATADAALEAVLARHREPHRRYHGEVHVARVVEAAHELCAAVDQADVSTIVLAAVFHDAVHDPTSSTNEADSAALAARMLTDLGVDDDTIERVQAMILATAGHTSDPATTPAADTAVLLDADLAILGADPAAYQSYVDGVRSEYASLDEVRWVTGRLQVVEALLAREHLFVSSEGRRLWDARARANLTAERHSLVRRRAATDRRDPAPS